MKNSDDLAKNEWTLRVAVTSSSLGQVLVATSDVGLCRVSLGDDAFKLREELAQRFPRAHCIEIEFESQSWAPHLRDLVDADPSDDSAFLKAAALPLDLRGTPFQRRVWRALKDIPRGETRSYAEVARRVGSPNAVRAVANACGDNPIALVIPCHRVVRTDGGLGGYRWGIDRKRRLLEREGQAQARPRAHQLSGDKISMASPANTRRSAPPF